MATIDEEIMQWDEYGSILAVIFILTNSTFPTFNCCMFISDDKINEPLIFSLHATSTFLEEQYGEMLSFNIIQPFYCELRISKISSIKISSMAYELRSLDKQRQQDTRTD